MCTDLYRTMVFARPASREDRKYMYELLTQPRLVEVNKLHDHLVMWKFAKERLTKYGFQMPDASMLFDTLKMSCEKLAEKDGEFKFQLQSFIKEHSSVNGLVDKDTVKQLYDMILDQARMYLTAKVEANKASTETPNTGGCFICGSEDHWYKMCPKYNGGEAGIGKGNFGKNGPGFGKGGKSSGPKGGKP